MSNTQDGGGPPAESASSSGSRNSRTNTPANNAAAAPANNTGMLPPSTAARGQLQQQQRIQSTTHPHIAAAILPSQHTLNAIAASSHIRTTNNTINNSSSILQRNASSSSLSSSASSSSSSSDVPLYYAATDSSRVATAATTASGNIIQREIPKSSFTHPFSISQTTSFSSTSGSPVGGALTLGPNAKANKTNASFGSCRTPEQTTAPVTTNNFAQSAVQTASPTPPNGSYSAMPVIASGMSANNSVAAKVVAATTQAPVSTHAHKNPLHTHRPMPANSPPPPVVVAGSSSLSSSAEINNTSTVSSAAPPYIANRCLPAQQQIPVTLVTSILNTESKPSTSVNNKTVSSVATPTTNKAWTNFNKTTLPPPTTAACVLSSPADSSMSHSSSSSLPVSSSRNNTITSSSTSTVTTTVTSPSSAINNNAVLHGVASRGLQLSNVERTAGRPLTLRSASFDSTSTASGVGGVDNKFGKPGQFRIISTPTTTMGDGKSAASLADVTATITLSRPSASNNTSAIPSTSQPSSSAGSGQVDRRVGKLTSSAPSSSSGQQARKSALSSAAPATSTGSWTRTSNATSRSPSRPATTSSPSTLLTVNDMVRRRSSGAYSTDSQSTTGGSDTGGRSMRSALSGSLCSVATAIESYPGDWQSMKTASQHGSTSSLNTFVTVQGDSYYEQTMERMRRAMDDLKQNLTAKDEHLKRLEQFNTDMKQQNRNLRSELDVKANELRDLQQQPATTTSPTKTGIGSSFLYRNKQKTAAGDEIGPLKTKLKELEKQVADLTKSKERFDRENTDIKTTLKDIIDNVERTPVADLVKDLKKKYEAAEGMCEELMDENDDLKKEQRDLESEMEEMGDRFRQHESVEMQDLQRELEQVTKTSRILQFKLRKAERQIEELEAATQNAGPNRFKPTTTVGKLSPSTSMMMDARDLDPRALQTELKMAREVSLRLQTQLESVEETKATLLQEKDNLRRHLMEVERERDMYQEQNDSLKADLQVSATLLSSAKSKTLSAKVGTGFKYFSSQKLGAKPSISDPPPPSSPSILRLPPLVKQCSTEEYSTLLRNLCDASERENDLREQKRFVEDEAKRLRKQLADVEGENESLHVQIRKLTNARTKLNAALPSSSAAAGSSSSAASASAAAATGGATSSDWKTPAVDELQMQLEVTEHELGQYKHRLSEAEQRNDTLTNDLRNLQERVKELRAIEEKFKLFTQQHEAEGAGDGEEPSSSGSAGRPRSYYEQKIRLLESELNDLRRRTVDREHEVERLNNELMTERRKRHMVRTRSQEDSEVSDLRRQLLSVEAELGQARSKCNALETESRRLVNENRRLTLRLSGTRSSFDENESMRQRVGTLQDELAEAQTEITRLRELAAANATAPSQSGGVLAERASETTFRKQFETLQREKQQARDEYNRIVHRMTPFRKDTATRQEMKDHIDKLDSNLRSVLVEVQDRDSVVKKLKQDVAQKDEELRSPLNRDSQSGLTQQEVKSLQQKVDDLEAKLSTSESRCDQLVEQLADEEKMAKQAASDSVARRHLETEVRNLKQELAKQRLVCDEWSYREDDLVRQAQEWQNKHKVLKEANTSQAELHAKEFSMLEQQCRTQVDELAALVRTKDTAMHYAEVEKRKAAEDLEALRFDIQCQTETTTSKTRAFEERVKELETLLERERKQAADAGAAQERAVKQQKLKTDDAKLQLDQFEVDLREAKRAYDELQLKAQREARALKEDKTKLETEIRVLKSDLSSARKEVRKQRRTNQSMNSSEDEQTADKTAGKRPSSAQALETQARLAVLEEQVATKDEESEAQLEKLDELRKEVDDLRSKLREVTKSEADLREQLEKKTQNLTTVDRSWKNERDDYQRKLRHEDKIHNAEISAIQMRSENKQKALEDECKSLKSTLKQYKKESENLRTRLEANMRECAELKRTVGELEKVQRDPFQLKLVTTKTVDVATAPKSPSVILRSMSSSVTSLVADENTIATLKLEVDRLKNELSKAERDKQDVKTKATRERSSYELKLSEVQTRLSQLENKTFQFGILGLKRTPAGSSASREDSGKKNQSTGDDTLTRLADLTAELEKTKRDSTAQVNELKRQLDNLNVEKEKSSEFWKKKSNDLQDRFTNANDQFSQLEYTYAKVRSEYDVLRIERDDLAERLMDTDSYQAAESQKIDQMLVEIQNIRQFVVEIEKDEAGAVLGELTEEEEVGAATTNALKKKTTRAPSLSTAPSITPLKTAARLLTPSRSPTSSHLRLPSHFDKQAARSAELQKAIDKISKFSEDIKAERRSRRRTAKPVAARSLSASLADARRRSSSGHHAHSMALSSTGLNNTGGNSIAERTLAYKSNLRAAAGGGGDSGDDLDSETNHSIGSSMTSLSMPHHPVNLPRRPGLVVTTPAGVDLPGGATSSDMYNNNNMPRSRSMEGSRNLGATKVTSERSSSTQRVKSTASPGPTTNWSSVDSNTSEMTNFEVDSVAIDSNKRMSMPNVKVNGDDSPSSRHHGKGFKGLLKNWTRKSATDKRGMFSKTKSEQHGAMTTSSIESSSEVSSPAIVAAGLQAMSAAAPAAASFTTRTRNVSGDSSTTNMSSTSITVVDHHKKFTPPSNAARPTSSPSPSVSTTNRTYVKPPSSESSDGESLVNQQAKHDSKPATSRLLQWRGGAKDDKPSAKSFDQQRK